MIVTPACLRTSRAGCWKSRSGTLGTFNFFSPSGGEEIPQPNALVAGGALPTGSILLGNASRGAAGTVARHAALCLVGGCPASTPAAWWRVASFTRPLLGHSLRDLGNQLLDDNVPE